MKITDLAEMNPSLPPSSNSSETMETMYKNVKNASRPITWGSVLYWVEVTDAFNSMELSVLTEEEAKKLWSEYASSTTLDADGAIQPDFIEASFGLPPMEGLPDSEEP